jgi:hypothetical protein
MIARLPAAYLLLRSAQLDSLTPNRSKWTARDRLWVLQPGPASFRRERIAFPRSGLVLGGGRAS